MPQAAVSGLQRASVPPSRNPRELWADTFRAVRAETERRQGADFDLRDFHRRALDVGSVGLDTLHTALLDLG